MTQTGEWKYTGDGDVIIGGKCPDIININGKKQVILVHGRYWHLEKFLENIPTLTKEDVERKDIEHYAKYGYQVLIVWDDELATVDNVVKKLVSFNGNKGGEINDGDSKVCI